MDPQDFEGKVILVTGGGSGIGRDSAMKIARRGGRVAVVDLSPEAAEATAREITEAGGEALSVAANVTDPTDLERAVAATVEHFGQLNGALNAAGIAGPAGLPHEIPLESYTRTVDVNLNGVFYSIRAEVPALIEAGGGSIVNISSLFGMVGIPLDISYVGAKHGVVGLTKSAALAYADQGVRVNSIHPGMVETPLSAAFSDEQNEALAAAHPMKRYATPDEISEVIAFLLSDRSSFVTGSQIVADGGYTAQ
ncbi:MAG: SDR family NAD(P)-dependent oxidoreductase [Pseudoclavibacter sp.]